ncbi:clathrin coat assembly protein-like protein [Leptomonas pyrrhocoris]|uniref:Clathrin coat assembly protein-like protein n=1 Tax=Leptomonas pyrrhocoris TaxID=157538 RepID=A0A0M9G359_LEPPY|nr:clathrin coat assembly protein-like protein [Leptomonas pyrrhocoris]XP_015659717.1 clathrin coat assembly protein-like protein [Leptomonas pyrrhocoris]KPA81277.1 clathrin coat assembly protein-like protein [Leptomonas pyrrhocoris]KPA81278.1 clathrin coat assembly protein-like protein [Leptomonas pyrrhocoris]|eukprot:XP_015659716.1 clathrin coat assembly protein-like protein [Leptomonas pyrrhocoris]
MISVLMFLNSRGDVVFSRSFRNGFNVRTLAETFRNELISSKLVDRCPVNFVNRTCFIHLKLTDLYVVMVSNSNVNCLVCLQYGVRLLQYIQSYFDDLDEKAVKENFVTLQSIIDESMDFGYPILTDMEAMTAFVTNDGVKPEVLKNTVESERIADRLTGVTPWRVEGCLYQNNEIFVDVFENVNLLLAQTGEVLQSNVTGRVVMNNFLSGMPECELHWNAKVMNRNQTDPVSTDGTGEELIPLSDISFHNCVRLTADGEEERRLLFVPPDGKFTLMTYRSSVNVQPPMKVIAATARELSRTRTELEFTLKSDAPPGQIVTEVAVTVPCPDNTAAASIKVPRGKATYDAVSHGIVWKLPKMRSGEEIPFFAEVRQIAPTEATETLWSKPPITIAFQCVSLSLTGLRITELKVHEPVFMYTPNKWIRYTVMAGDYQCRL